MSGQPVFAPPQSAHYRRTYAIARVVHAHLKRAALAGVEITESVVAKGVSDALAIEPGNGWLPGEAIEEDSELLRRLARHPDFRELRDELNTILDQGDEVSGLLLELLGRW